MRRSNHSREFSRTELISGRRGGADVVPFGSLFRVSPTPFSRPWKVGGAPSGGNPCARPVTAGATRGLYAGPRRQAGPLWTCSLLDRGRYRDGARHVVGGDRDLFRVSR